jgi:hypothetical protein
MNVDRSQPLSRRWDLRLDPRNLQTARASCNRARAGDETHGGRQASTGRAGDFVSSGEPACCKRTAANSPGSQRKAPAIGQWPMFSKPTRIGSPAKTRAPTHGKWIGEAADYRPRNFNSRRRRSAQSAGGCFFGSENKSMTPAAAMSTSQNFKNRDSPCGDSAKIEDRRSWGLR